MPASTGPERGRSSFTPEEIADLRGKLAAWEDDWSAPGMEEYDDYEVASGHEDVAAIQEALDYLANGDTGMPFADFDSAFRERHHLPTHDAKEG